jgi:hypothetical protein
VLIPDLAATSDDLSEAALVARFPRPAGEFVLLKLHEFPLLRIPLRPEEPLELATVADLPPSTVPRTPLAEAVAVQQQATPLEEVLASLNRALARGTREEYVEHFVPALRGAQGQLFDTIRSLPLEEVTLQARGETMTQTATGDGDTLQHPVSWSYAVVGAEPGAHLSADVELGLRRDTGRWQIAQIGGQAPFWALGPTEAERAGPFWIFYRPSAEPRLASLKADLAPALQVVEERFPDRLEPVHLMFVTETPQEFADLTGRDPARFSGLALSRYRIEEGGIATTEATFYINGATFWAASEADRRQTLVHELAHLLLAPTTMPFTPVWLVEGMAMEIAGDLPQEVMRAQIAAGEIDIFRLDAFTTQPGFGLHDPGGAQTAADYAYAAYLARFLVERYGFETFLAFYDSFANVPVEDVRDELAAGGQSQDLSRTLGKLAGDLTPERLQIAYGIDLATLEQEFVTWLRQQVG